MRGRSLKTWMRATEARCLLVAALAAATMTVGAAPATAAPAWRIDGLSNTTIAPGGTSGLLVQMTNVGDTAMNAASDSMTFDVTMPSGLRATSLQVLTNSGLMWNCFGTVFPASAVACRDRTDTIAPTFSAYVVLGVSATAGVLPGDVKKIALDVSGGGAAPQSAIVPVTVSSSLPGFGVAVIDGQITADAAGTPIPQAGGHPYAAAVSFDLNTFSKPSVGDAWPVEPLKDAYVDLPPGLVGDPSGVRSCTAPELANTNSLEPQSLCPPESQVGTVMIRLNGADLLGYAIGPIPVFNMAPPADVPARFGFNVLGSVVTLDAKVRSGSDYGITIAVANAPEAIPLAGTTVSLWGSPADPSHDAERACPGVNAPWRGGPTCSSTADVTAFVRNPTSCEPAAGSPITDGLVTTLHVDSWANPGRLGADGMPDLTDPAWKSNSFVSHDPPAYPLPSGEWGAHTLPTNCAAVPFDPTLAGQPDVDAKPGDPAGFSFDLDLPQPNDPLLPGESDLRSAQVQLPAGVRVSPSSANGLGACSSAQIDLHGAADPTCPDSSKVGTVSITTPLLPDPLDGAVYLAAQGDNPFNSLLAIYVVAHGPGVVVKLAGHVQADPVTGQLSTTFDDNPQLPFSRLHLEFDGGSRAPLVVPQQCGIYTTLATLTGWNGRSVPANSTFTVSGDAAECSGGTSFSPNLLAGTENPVGAADSTFNLRLTREDRDQEIKALTVEMPSGLTGRIANVDLCGDAQAAAGTCGEGARVGSVTVGAGPGSDPFYVTGGRAYLTGPYKGGPFGLSIVVPAKAGPFDLGTVVVRSALFVDKHTANVRVVSDPLPTILQGIPLDVRDVRVSVDRKNFFLNPSSCEEKTINGTIESTSGTTAHVSTRFQVRGCSRLGFKPRMVLTVGGRRHTARGRTTPLSTIVTMPRGDSNLSYVKVQLPGTINARLTVIGDACTRDQFETDFAKCAHAKAGTAKAVTPLLRDPLTGGVYFVKDGRGLPKLFVALRGQVDFDLIGRIAVVRNKYLTTTFDSAPDVPITSFSLRLLGDPRNASLGARVNLCRKRGRTTPAELTFRAQNGREIVQTQRPVVRGCKKPKKKHGKAAHRGR